MAQRKDKILYVGIGVLLLVVFVCGIANKQAVVDQMNSWKLLPRPERLTELYFNDHQNLPSTYAPGQTQRVSFTIHNLEYRRTSYTYVVTANAEGDSPPVELLRGYATLPHDKSAAPNLNITLPNAGPRAQIKITLYFDGIELGQDLPSPQNQSIHYWVNQKGAI